MSREERKQVEIAVKRLLRKGAIAPAQGSKDQCFSNAYFSVFLHPEI